MKIAAVDLFCGAGGLTKGFEKAGLPVLAGYDLDPACKFPYEANNAGSFVLADLSDYDADEIRKNIEKADIKVLAGCAPCQPFSTYTRTRGRDSRAWSLLPAFARITKEVQPDIIAMENVPQLALHPVFGEFVAELESLGYFTSYYEVQCQLYGIPQTRKRLAFFASRFGKVDLIPPTHTEETPVTVRETIGHLKPLKAGEVSKRDPLHRASKLSELNMRRIRASKPGGSWRDWPEDLRAKCHLKDSGETFPSVYGRMEWEKPSPTITTQCFGYGNGRFGHPDQDRAISLREAALIQTFPENYVFSAPGDSITFSVVGRLIGNAVPVRLGEVVAQSILNHLKDSGRI